MIASPAKRTYADVRSRTRATAFALVFAWPGAAGVDIDQERFLLRVSSAARHVGHSPDVAVRIPILISLCAKVPYGNGSRGFE